MQQQEFLSISIRGYDVSSVCQIYIMYLRVLNLYYLFNYLCIKRVECDTSVNSQLNYEQD